MADSLQHESAVAGRKGLVMGVWRAFLDDSGSDGSPFNPDFTPKAIDPMDGSTKFPGMVSPVTTVALVAFNTNACQQVAADVLRFQRQIQKQYSLSVEPQIHMRHLWGRKARHDNGKNPFFGMPEIDRVAIATMAYELSAKIKTDYGGIYVSFDTDVVEHQKEALVFYSQPRQIKDREILYAHFNKKQIIKFYNLLNHSTMGLVSSATMDFNNKCGDRGNIGVINYDDSDASKGFDTSALFSALKQHGWAKHVDYGTHQPKVNSALLQLADLATFRAYRRQLAHFRGDPDQKNDPFKEVSQALAEHFKITAPVVESELLPSEGDSVHYLVARNYLESINPKWVNKHMKTFIELQADFCVSLDGTPLIRDSSYEKYLRDGRLT